MKKSELFQLAIKVIGLTLLPDFIRTFSQVVSMIPLMRSSPFGEMMGSGAVLINGAVLLISYLLPIYLFLFQSRWISRMVFKKESEDEMFQLPFSRSNIIELACLLTGGITFVSNVPKLITFSGIATTNNFSSPIPGYHVTTYYGLADIASLVIAVLMIIFSKRIASYFAKENNAVDLNSIDQNNTI